MITGITEIAAKETSEGFQATVYTKLDGEPVFVNTAIIAESRVLAIQKGKEWWNSLNDPEAMIKTMQKEQAPQ